MLKKELLDAMRAFPDYAPVIWRDAEGMWDNVAQVVFDGTAIIIEIDDDGGRESFSDE